MRGELSLRNRLLFFYFLFPIFLFFYFVRECFIYQILSLGCRHTPPTTKPSQPSLLFSPARPRSIINHFTRSLTRDSSNPLFFKSWFFVNKYTHARTSHLFPSCPVGSCDGLPLQHSSPPLPPLPLPPPSFIIIIDQPISYIPIYC